MPFWKCYYHIIWSTKYREPIIDASYEQVIFAAIEQKSAELGCVLLALNGVSDHIHAAVSVPPSMAVSTWVGSIKGVSSRAVNTTFERETRFRWQEGYGVMSCGESALPKVKQYIASQKERHASDDLNTYLERIEDDD